jgi:hypothetical protein
MTKNKSLKRIRDFRGGERTNFAEKSCQNFKILLTKEGLLLDIQKFRDKWNIPVKFETPIKEEAEPPEMEPIPFEIPEFNFPKPENTKKVQEWSEGFRLNKALEALMQSEKQLPPVHKQAKEDKQQFREMIELMKKYSIDSIYFELFRGVIYTSTIFSHHFKKSNKTGACFSFMRDIDGNPCMGIRIFPETTTEDILAEWQEIELHRDKFLGYNLPKHPNRKNIDRDLRVVQLKYAGYKAEAIAKQINQEFLNEVGLIYQEINKIVYEISKLHKKKLVLP